MKLLTIVFSILFSAPCIFAKDIRIITPYAGTIQNKLTIDEMDQKLDDSALLAGLYFQWIKPQKYQWNIFLYNSRDINGSTLIGSHFIFDYYFGVKQKGKYVAGIGFDMIRIDTKDLSLTNLSDFEMLNVIYAPYIRFGRYFNFGNNNLKNSVLLWGGFEDDLLRGDISFNIPPKFPGMPVIPVEEKLDHDYEYALVGLTLKSTILHFIELKIKYHGKISLESDDYLNVVSFMFNTYMSRKLGISYRFKYMEETIGTNTYHMGGIALML
jgi:hypothetical protein